MMMLLRPASGYVPSVMRTRLGVLVAVAVLPWVACKFEPRGAGDASFLDSAISRSRDADFAGSLPSDTGTDTRSPEPGVTPTPDAADPDSAPAPGPIASPDAASDIGMPAPPVIPPDARPIDPCANLPAGQCCSDRDCGMCEKCSAARTCVPQTANEDRKNDCPDDVPCKTGTCNGQAACGNAPNGSQTTGCRNPNSCNGYAQTTADACEAGVCRRGDTSACPKVQYGCTSNNLCATGCPKDRPFDTGSECIACGSPGQKCCPGTRDARCRGGSWCCDTNAQKGCEGQPQLLNTCVAQLKRGDDCNVAREDQCPGGTRCEFDVNICCLPCTGTRTCDLGGICTESVGGPCTTDADCSASNGLFCRVNMEVPARMVCQKL